MSVPGVIDAVHLDPLHAAVHAVRVLDDDVIRASATA